MRNLIQFIKDNPKLSVNIVPTGKRRNLKLVVLVDNSKYKKLLQQLKSNGDVAK